MSENGIRKLLDAAARYHRSTTSLNEMSTAGDRKAIAPSADMQISVSEHMAAQENLLKVIEELDLDGDFQFPLTIAGISRVSLQRALQWHHGGIQEWSASDWGVAAGGESGELSEAMANLLDVCALSLRVAGKAGQILNALKKFNRVRDDVQQAKGPKDFDEARKAIAQEMGDTYLYMDLLATRLGIDLEQAIRDTFNRVSEREGFSQRL